MLQHTCTKTSQLSLFLSKKHEPYVSFPLSVPLFRRQCINPRDWHSTFHYPLQVSTWAFRLRSSFNVRLLLLDCVCSSQKSISLLTSTPYPFSYLQSVPRMSTPVNIEINILFLLRLVRTFSRACVVPNRVLWISISP